MSIEKNILRILEEINKSQKSILHSIGLNEDTTLSPPLNKLYVTSPFGPRWGRQHIGVDLVANAENVKFIIPATYPHPTHSPLIHGGR